MWRGWSDRRVRRWVDSCGHCCILLQHHRNSSEGGWNPSGATVGFRRPRYQNNLPRWLTSRSGEGRNEDSNHVRILLTMYDRAGGDSATGNCCWQGLSGVEEHGGFRGRCAGREVLVGKRKKEKVRVGSGQSIGRPLPGGGLVGWWAAAGLAGFNY